MPSLRKWLTIKQQESAAGRAELALSERANLWGAKPEKNRLPSIVEWSSIGLLTNRSRWNFAQRQMMMSASKYYANRVLISFCVCFLLGWLVYDWNGGRRATSMLGKLSVAEIGQVNSIIDDLDGFERWSGPRLKSLLKETKEPSLRVRYALAFLPHDSAQVEYILSQLPNLKPSTVAVVAEEMKTRQDLAAIRQLWEMLESESTPARTRFHAAMILAQLDPEGEQAKNGWKTQGAFLSGELVDIDPVDYPAAIEALRPIRGHLFKSLHAAFVGDDSAHRNMATSALLEYAADEPQPLSELVFDSNAHQYVRVFEIFEQHGDASTQLMLAEIANASPDDASAAELEVVAKRHANAAVGLVRMGRLDDVWSLLRHDPNPRTRSHLIHRLAALGAPPSEFVGKIEAETDESTRRAIFQLLGEYKPDQLGEAARDQAIEVAKAAWLKDEDPGVHSSAQWFLREWGEQEFLRENSGQLPSKLSAVGGWYVATGGHTMANIDGREQEGIGRVFEIATMEVSRRQIEEFNAAHPVASEYSPEVDCPAGVVLWYDAVRYCQWLNEEAKIPKTQWCYPPRSEITNETTPMAADLTKTGFRLPTDEEWIYACNAGATTSRFYGEDDDLMLKYAWVFENSQNRTWPTGTRKPNDYGLFDLYGNVTEWRATLVYYDSVKVKIGGGAFSTQVTERLTSAFSGSSDPGTDYANRGFRIARTHVVEE